MDEALFLCAGHSQPPLLSLWGFNMRQHKENDQKGNWSGQDSIVASYKYPAWKPRARAPEDAIMKCAIILASVHMTWAYRKLTKSFANENTHPAVLRVREGCALGKIEPWSRDPKKKKLLKNVLNEWCNHWVTVWHVRAVYMLAFLATYTWLSAISGCRTPD